MGDPFNYREAARRRQLVLLEHMTHLARMTVLIQRGIDEWKKGIKWVPEAETWELEGKTTNVKDIPDIIYRVEPNGKKMMGFPSNYQNNYFTNGDHMAFTVPHEFGAPRYDWIEQTRGEYLEARMQATSALEYVQYTNYKEKGNHPKKLHYHPIFITKGAIYTSDKDVEVVQFIRGDFYAKLFKNTQTKFHNAMGIWGYELEIASHYWRFSNSIPDNLLDETVAYTANSKPDRNQFSTLTFRQQRQLTGWKTNVRSRLDDGSEECGFCGCAVYGEYFWHKPLCAYDDAYDL